MTGPLLLIKFLMPWMCCSVVAQLHFVLGCRQVRIYNYHFLVAGVLYLLSLFIQYFGFRQGVSASIFIPYFNLSQVVLLLVARYYLREQISVKRWLGVLLVFGGGSPARSWRVR